MKGPYKVLALEDVRKDDEGSGDDDIEDTMGCGKGRKNKKLDNLLADSITGIGIMMIFAPAYLGPSHTNRTCPMGVVLMKH